VSPGAVAKAPANTGLWKEKVAVGLLLGPSLFAMYAATAVRASQTATRPPAWLVTPLDRVVPTVPEAVWIYLSWYPAMALLVLTSGSVLRTGYVAYVLAFGGCALGHVLLPASIDRPLLRADSGLSEQALQMVYALDPPYNLFPSVHAACAAVLASLARTATRLRGAAALWTAALCLSCVLVRQHFLIDVLAGVAVGIAATWLAGTVVESRFASRVADSA